MQLYPVILVALVLAADGGLRVSPGDDGSWLGPLVAAGGPALVLVVAAVLLEVARRGLAAGRGGRSIVLADRVLRGGRVALLVAHGAACLGTGWLAWIRGYVGDLILIDELIAISPPIVGLLGLWWLYYPLERRLRESMQIRRLDLGLPLHPVPSRARFVLHQTRLNLLLLLVPVLLILTMSELLPSVLARTPAPTWVSEVLTFAAGLTVFVFAPALARVILDVEPLAGGPLRDDLQAVCREHAVRVRELLLWKTDGLMINAAVMGLVGRVRFVLLTDGLVEMLSRDEVIAVMAHEIGHVRRHHMPWLVLSLMSMLLLAGLLVSAPFYALQIAGVTFKATHLPWIDAGITLGSAALALAAFGWLSRRYERQADTFAVQHLSRAVADPDADPKAGPPSVTSAAVGAMDGALGTISRLNNVGRQRPSWRHGSIAWRQAYLRSLIGRPLEGLPIDRFVRHAKVVVAISLIVGLASIWTLEHLAAEQVEQAEPMVVLIEGAAATEQEP